MDTWLFSLAKVSLIEVVLFKEDLVFCKAASCLDISYGCFTLGFSTHLSPLSPELHLLPSPISFPFLPKFEWRQNAEAAHNFALPRVRVKG